jgi:hypothetical protein
MLEEFRALVRLDEWRLLAYQTLRMARVRTAKG